MATKQRQVTRMNEGPAPDIKSAATVARIVHGAISAGLLIVFLVFAFLATGSRGPTVSGGERALRIIGYALIVLAVIATQVIRGRIPRPDLGAGPDRFWVSHMSRALTLWAVAEAGGLAALVMGWIVGDTTLMALGAAVGLALLFVHRPGRLQGIA